MTEETKTLATQIHETLMKCLYERDEVADGDIPADAIIVNGITHNLGLHPGRVAANKEKIRGYLNEMPASFHVTGGGGMSFLSLCRDKHAHQWGEHSNMEQLVNLGQAAGMASYCAPREMWSVFPGGMPYVQFDTRTEEEKESAASDPTVVDAPATAVEGD